MAVVPGFEDRPEFSTIPQHRRRGLGSRWEVLQQPQVSEIALRREVGDHKAEKDLEHHD